VLFRSEEIGEGDYSGPGGARLVLRDRRVDVAILETARGGMLRRGLGVERDFAQAEELYGAAARQWLEGESFPAVATFALGRERASLSTPLTLSQPTSGEAPEFGLSEPAGAVVEVDLSAIDEAPAVFENILGKTPTLPDLVNAGLRFRDAGECQVPGGGRSVHMRFETDGSIGPAGLAVSLFIQGGMPQNVTMEPDIAYRLTAQTDSQSDTPDEAMTVYGWFSQDLTYYLVTKNDQTAQQVRTVVGMPKPTSDGS